MFAYNIVENAIKALRECVKTCVEINKLCYNVFQAIHVFKMWRKKIENSFCASLFTSLKLYWIFFFNQQQIIIVIQYGCSYKPFHGLIYVGHHFLSPWFFLNQRRILDSISIFRFAIKWLFFIYKHCISDAKLFFEITYWLMWLFQLHDLFAIFWYKILSVHNIWFIDFAYHL